MRYVFVENSIKLWCTVLCSAVQSVKLKSNILMHLSVSKINCYCIYEYMK